jgi:hypothetical protein
VPPRTAAGAARAGRPGGSGSASGARSGRTIGVLVGIAAVIVVAVIVGVFVLGGNGAKPAAKPNTVAPAASATTPAANDGNASNGSATAKVNRSQVVVAVLNGTTFTGLARSASDKLTRAGFHPGVVTNDTTNQTRSATAIFFADGQRNAAYEVAKIVGIGRDAVQKLDANTRGVAGQDADVVVSVGSDQAR